MTREACPRGHQYTEDNCYWAPGARWPQCRACRRLVSREQRRKARRAHTVPGKTPRNDNMPPQGTPQYQRERRARIRAGTWVMQGRGTTAAEDRARKARQDEITQRREARLEARREARWKQEQEDAARLQQERWAHIEQSLQTAPVGSLQRRRLLEARALVLGVEPAHISTQQLEVLT